MATNKQQAFGRVSVDVQVEMNSSLKEAAACQPCKMIWMELIRDLLGSNNELHGALHAWLSNVQETAIACQLIIDVMWS